MGGKNGKTMVAGHVCLDVTPVFPQGRVKGIGELLAPGKLINVGEAAVSTGGAVANTGLAMKILGADVRLAGKIGSDHFGGIVQKLFGEYGCAGDLLVDERASTSYSVVLAPPGVDRIFLHHPGANDTFGAGDVTGAMLEGVEHFHFGYPPIMRRMFLNEGEELKKLLTFVKERGITTSLDMAAIDPDSEAGKQDWQAILRNVMPLVDFFLPSIEEAGYMLDRDLHNEWRERAAGGDITRILSLDRDIRPVADRLMEMGATVLLIKCGAPGMYYRSAGDAGIEKMRKLCAVRKLNSGGWIGKEGFEKSYVQKNVVSGTGAGDISIAAFLTAMLRGKDMEPCVRLAAAAGACCVAAHDALSGLLPLEALQAKIDSGWDKEVFSNICGR